MRYLVICAVACVYSWQTKKKTKKQTLGSGQANDRFRDAMTLTVSEFIESVKEFTESWLPARSLVESAFRQRYVSASVRPYVSGQSSVVSGVPHDQPRFGAA